MASIAYQLTPQLSCHAWTADKLHLAVCPNNHEIYVYRKSPTGQWTHTHTLSDHDQLVSGLDWSTGSNQLVSCSHDRNSYVFSWQDQTLKPEMVITRLSKAATCVKWSPCQRKFAIGSAAKAVCICYYEQESHWWASKLIRKQHDSSILMVAWHPDSILLATASSDSKCRVFSTALPGVDSDQHLGGLSSKFGDCLLQVDSLSGWCHAVAWSPSGSQLCFASHGSTLQFVQGLDRVDLLNSRPIAQDQITAPSMQLLSHLQHQPVQQCVHLRQLPCKVIAFLQETVLIAGGFDGEMYMFGCKKQHWQLLKVIQGDLQQSHDAQLKKQMSADFSKKLDMFKQQTASPVNNKVTRRTTHPQVGGPHHRAHTSCIVDLHVFDTQHKTASCQYSTAGLDGQVVVWDVATCVD